MEPTLRLSARGGRIGPSRSYLGSPDRTGTDSLQADKAGTSGGCQGGQGCRAAPESPETVGVELPLSDKLSPSTTTCSKLEAAPARGPTNKVAVKAII